MKRQYHPIISTILLLLFDILVLIGILFAYFLNTTHLDLISVIWLISGVSAVMFFFGMVFVIETDDYRDRLDDYHDYKRRYDTDILYLKETINDLSREISELKNKNTVLTNNIDNNLANELDSILEKYFKQLVSHNRDSRQEFVRTHDYSDIIKTCQIPSCKNFDGFKPLKKDCLSCIWKYVDSNEYPCYECSHFSKHTPIIACNTCKYQTR